ncbi:hypothetical protein [Spiroplasma endosymbiont of 'Nebria riversi']|uniref:hypothetical protein n=1 Tax=Spiroplasma endosymbiont of 'Nebria riversi' TaxID=2792084 RepID=UPI001C04B871|nr:hypothetical protein [Spiroplasma endosymbiont of 'Nebria riversi']
MNILNFRYIFIWQRWIIIIEKIIQELVNTLTDDKFLEFYEKVKQQAELIKKTKTFKWNWSKI